MSYTLAQSREPMMLRLAHNDEIDTIKRVAAKHTRELGFILRPALEEAVRRGELLFDQGTGAFCHYHRRRDGVTVIYEICVPPEARGRGIGRTMVDMLLCPVQCKCPEDNASNGFYEHIGFTRVAVEPGKKRKLNVWRLESHRAGAATPA
jgi:ribosomal protein S18 acetylase RimI-like enzyme